MKIIIDDNQSDQRLDRFLRKYFKPYPSVSLGSIFAWLRMGSIKVNWRKRKENYRLIAKDEIDISDEEVSKFMHKSWAAKHKWEQRSELTLEEIKDMIVYEDEFWIVFNKPAGIVLHGWDKQENSLSMHDYLKRYTKLTGIEVNETFSPQFCYRLDKDTSGVLIAAKTYESLQFLNQQIRERKLQKKYLTVTVWVFPASIKMDEPLKKVFDKWFGRWKTVAAHPEDPEALEARSQGTLIKTVKDDILWDISLVQVQIKTGRMHQIRVHLADAGYPVLWDIVYGDPASNRRLYKKHKIPRQLLHCQQYSFRDALQQKQMTFEVPTSKDIAKLII